MKESYWGYWLMVLGVFIIVVLLLVQSYTSTNTQDYYLVKEITESAMVDAVDYAYYRQFGEVKINKEKFYEVFLRRFAEEASLSTVYTIEFAEIYEAPPKVGVQVSSKSAAFNISGDSTTFDIVNKIDAILETKTKDSQGTGENVKEPDVNPSNPDTPTNPGEDTPSEEKLHDVGFNIAPAGIQQSNRRENVTTKWGTYDVNFACACGPIAITEAAYFLGKTNNLKGATGYNGSDFNKLAAATYVGMNQVGLNGNPTSTNTDASSSSFCGRVNDYNQSNSFYNSIGISVAGSGGKFGKGPSGHAKAIYDALASGQVVVASLAPGFSAPSDSTLRSTTSGHYYTIYGYDATNNCFKVYNPMVGQSCEKYDNVNSSFTEYIAFK